MRQWIIGLASALVAVAILAAGDDPSGHWEGAIELPGSALRVRVDLTLPASSDTSAWSGTIDIPAQGAEGLPLIDIVVDGSRLRFSIGGVPGNPTFDGVLRDGEVSGDFSQGAARLPFRLGREAMAPRRRPQDPVPPLPYRAEEVTYRQGEVTLAGTLTLPAGAGPFPAAVLITGSGAQNRDEELFDHRPFLVLADQLTRSGVAVLRSDDRGVGGSTGDVNGATSADFAADALAGVEFLAARPEIAKESIGLIGHSEGGLIGPLAAVQSSAVAYVVMLAGPGVAGAEILPLQTRRLALVAGGEPQQVAAQEALVERMVELLVAEDDPTDLRARLQALGREQLELGGAAAREALGDDPDAVIEQQIDRALSPWFRFFMRYQPGPTLRRLEVPVLALNGALDLQVDAEQNLPAIEAALAAAGNPDVTIRRLPGLNHLFQHAVTGGILEYGQIEETFAPEVLEMIAEWIVSRFASPASAAVPREGGSSRPTGLLPQAARAPSSSRRGSRASR